MPFVIVILLSIILILPQEIGNQIIVFLNPIHTAEASADRPSCRTNHFPILMYHHIREYEKLDKDSQDLSVSPKEFTDQITYLHSVGYTTITSRDIKHNTIPCHSIMLTFDDGYNDVYQNAFPLMDTLGYRGILGLIVTKIDQAGYLSSSDIHALKKAGWEIASHTWTHEWLTQVPRNNLTIEIKNSKTYFEKSFHTIINIFIYPGGFFGPESLKMVRKSRYNYALTAHFGEARLTPGRKFILNRINMLPGTTVEKLTNLLEQARHSR